MYACTCIRRRIIEWQSVSPLTCQRCHSSMSSSQNNSPPPPPPPGLRLHHAEGAWMKEGVCFCTGVSRWIVLQMQMRKSFSDPDWDEPLSCWRSEPGFWARQSETHMPSYSRLGAAAATATAAAAEGNTRSARFQFGNSPVCEILNLSGHLNPPLVSSERQQQRDG